MDGVAQAIYIGRSQQRRAGRRGDQAHIGRAMDTELGARDRGECAAT